jgi:amino acid permease
VGAGILALPFTFKSTGVLVQTVILLLAGLLGW